MSSNKSQLFIYTYKVYVGECVRAGVQVCVHYSRLTLIAVPSLNVSSDVDSGLSRILHMESFFPCLKFKQCFFHKAVPPDVLAQYCDLKI